MIENIANALSAMLGIAEMDCLDDKSNVWRSAMIDARKALEDYEAALSQKFRSN